MKRINVTFYDEIHEKLEARTKEKNGSSMAQSIRELVDLGFKIEESANKNLEGKNESDSLSFMIDVMKNNLKWSLETLLITRHMIEQLDESNDSHFDEVLKKCKEQARNHIKKIFSDEGEIEN